MSTLVRTLTSPLLITVKLQTFNPVSYHQTGVQTLGDQAWRGLTRFKSLKTEGVTRGVFLFCLTDFMRMEVNVQIFILLSSSLVPGEH